MSLGLNGQNSCPPCEQRVAAAKPLPDEEVHDRLQQYDGKYAKFWENSSKY